MLNFSIRMNIQIVLYKMERDEILWLDKYVLNTPSNQPVFRVRVHMRVCVCMLVNLFFNEFAY